MQMRFMQRALLGLWFLAPMVALIGLNPEAKVHRVRVGAYPYLYTGLLSLVVLYLVRAVGGFLVMARLLVPAAAARNLARSAGGMVWGALQVSVTSAAIGWRVSAQDWARTATGATVILAAFGWVLASSGIGFI